MKKTLLIIMAFSLLISSAFYCYKSWFKQSNSVSNDSIQSKHTVIIDPGHGGIDNGTCSVDGIKEKDINLKIAQALYDYLMVCGINTLMTRYGDYEMYNDNEVRNRSDLYNRLDFISSVDNALMVSIHQNFFKQPAEWGMQIWYSPNDENSKLMADNILNVNSHFLNNTNGRTNRKSTDDYYILYKATVPSVMIECGFLSNKAETNKLKTNDYQNDIAYCIMLGLNKFIGS